MPELGRDTAMALLEHFSKLTPTRDDVNILVSEGVVDLLKTKRSHTSARVGTAVNHLLKIWKAIAKG